MACPQPAKYDYYASGGTLGTFGAPEVSDPVQGNYLKNCSLIAAFASLAWKGKIPAQPAGPATTYTFQFYNPTIQVRLDGKTPLDATGKLLHAKSDAPTEIWPALYEKAYYMWLDNITDPAVRPDYSKYEGWQSPVTVLKQLTGKAVSQIPATPLVALNAFNNIDAYCDNLITNTNRAIKSPAVAWTYDTGAQYSDTKIIVQHTYSLLGVAGTKDAQGNWTNRYVVLRNPYGSTRGDPVGLPGGSLYTGPLWSRNINLGNNDGIFALRHDLFAQYFAGYAWIL
jgi:hypothetical protein